MNKSAVIFLLLLLEFAFSCRKEDALVDKSNSGKIILKFAHKVNGATLQTDTMIYINEAGNPYEVNEIQYFVSDVTLHKSDGTKKMISDQKDIDYVDIDMPATLTWTVYDSIIAGTYDSVSFTFGISAQKNHSFMFANPPESDMFWPTVLGGGYHMMKMNGKWKTTTNDIDLFNFHLGIGQIITGADTTFVHNNFNVSLPSSSFVLEKGQTKVIQIVMNIENWFKNPNTYDFNVWGGSIMQNQDAMQAVKENGHDVFSIGYIN